jgi:hypothetical protein
MADPTRYLILTRFTPETGDLHAYSSLVLSSGVDENGAFVYRLLSPSGTRTSVTIKDEVEEVWVRPSEPEPVGVSILHDVSDDSGMAYLHKVGSDEWIWEYSKDLETTDPGDWAESWRDAVEQAHGNLLVIKKES